ncbi:MAG: hypothetical protein QOF49_2358 [Chloroflexota bacterium]|nr:hypothetical protein [Chloroflexota bacterium]
MNDRSVPALLDELRRLVSLRAAFDPTDPQHGQLDQAAQLVARSLTEALRLQDEEQVSGRGASGAGDDQFGRPSVTRSSMGLADGTVGDSIRPEEADRSGRRSVSS